MITWSPDEPPHGAVTQQETQLVLPHRVQPHLETHRGRGVADLLPRPLHCDPVSETHQQGHKIIQIAEP